jgi:5-methyltetrahydropteroyltriglutamate--homocysteine methyltransferase
MTQHHTLTTSVIGSWSFPGWFAKLCADAASHPELYGPDDLEEALRDAVRLAVEDQLEAGIDILTDGEMQRVDFNLGFYEHLTGLERMPRRRLHGPPAHDQRTKYRCVAPLAAPGGLGLVAEYRRLRDLLTRRVEGVSAADPKHAPPIRVKVPIPGPFTLAGCIQGGEVYRDRVAVTDALLPIVNQEMKNLVAAGVDFIQLDEPSFACHAPVASEREAASGVEAFLDVLQRTVAGVQAKISLHLCFGNYRARAVGWRSYRPLFPRLAQLARASVQQLALEFASREMAEIDLAKHLPPPLELAIGLIDVKNTWIEPPQLVADRLRQALQFIEPERVHVTPDCGFSQTARFIAQQKLANMVAGVRLVRGW